MFVFIKISLLQLKSFLLGIFGLLRRTICFHRKNHSVNHLELENINIVIDISDTNDNHIQKQKTELVDWNSWEDKHTLEDHIREYRRNKLVPPQLSKTVESDFFTDITPTIKPQVRYYLNEETEPTKLDFSRLKIDTDVPIPTNVDLEDWIEEKECDWEEIDYKKTRELIRETRRNLRINQQKS